MTASTLRNRRIDRRRDWPRRRLKLIGLVQPPLSVSALDGVVGDQPADEDVAQFFGHWVKPTVPPTGSDRLPTIVVSVPDHAIEPHVTATEPDDE